MDVVTFSLSALFSSFILHLIVWRIRIPKAQGKTIVLIFVLTYGLLIAINSTTRCLSLNWIDHVHVAAIFFSALLVYLIFFTAIEETSPTFLMLLSVEKSGSKGTSRAELYDLLKRFDPVEDKIAGLLATGRIALSGGRFAITSKGIRLIRVFSLYRAIIGIPEGRG